MWLAQCLQWGRTRCVRADSSSTHVRSTVEAYSSLALTLRPLQPILANMDVTELCINQRGEAFIETNTGWQREQLPFADFDWCMRLSKLVTHATHQRVAENSPLLSAALPSGERIQVVLLPPATAPSRIAIAIRRPGPYASTHVNASHILGVIHFCFCVCRSCHRHITFVELIAV